MSQSGDFKVQESGQSETSLGSQGSSERGHDTQKTRLSRILDIVFWTPPWCRWDEDDPPKFSMALNALFGLAGCFTVANLYYSHPILNILATDFDVAYVKASQIPTLAQSGYAVGLFFLCPLGDLIRRRRFTLTLIFFTATVWIGLCTTHSFAAFSAISFITAVTTVTPQIMLPLVGDLAPPHKRAMSLSIVASGNLLGILIARLLSGIVTNYASWRAIYWIALALQYTILVLLWLFMPDYPSTNPDGLNYFKMLWDVVYMVKKHPVVTQACLIALASSAPFTSYWTVLTFLLADNYGYSSLDIGLWALIGIAGIATTPLIARRLIDKFVPLFSCIWSTILNLIGVVVGTYSGLYGVAGVAIQAYLLDVGLQCTQIANRSSIYTVEPKARNRVNTTLMVSTFFGQIIGTSAGNKLYADSGWVAAGSLSVGFLVFALIITMMRGPYEEGWVGWSGGTSMRKRDKMSADGKAVDETIGAKKRERIESGKQDVPAHVDKANEKEPSP